MINRIRAVTFKILEIDRLTSDRMYNCLYGQCWVGFVSVEIAWICVCVCVIFCSSFDSRRLYYAYDLITLVITSFYDIFIVFTYA